MIRLVLEVDDHYTWAELTKEAVAELLEPLGTVRVLAVKTDKPEQTRMEPPKPAPAAEGSVWVQLVDETWVRGDVTGDKAEAHTVGFGIHQC